MNAGGSLTRFSSNEETSWFPAEDGKHFNVASVEYGGNLLRYHWQAA